MDFWTGHDAREAELAAAREAEARARTLAARHPQDAPATCADCGVVSPDVLLGYCGACA